MHLIDHGRSHIEKTYKRPFNERMIRNLLSWSLSKANNFKFISKLVLLAKPFSLFLPKKIKNMINLMPINFPKKTLPNTEIYPALNRKKPVARVALLTGCVQKIISPQINEATIRLLNRHGIEVIVPKSIECCGSLNHHLGKEILAKQTFKNNITNWYEEYLNNGLDAIISNTSGCGTTIKDYKFIFRDDKELKKKAKKISELTKDISEYLNEKVKLNFIEKLPSEKKYNKAYYELSNPEVTDEEYDNLKREILSLEIFQIPAL